VAQWAFNTRHVGSDLGGDDKVASRCLASGLPKMSWCNALAGLYGMWIIDPDFDLDALTPAEPLWVVALSIEENGGPAGEILVVRQLAASLEDLSWWLTEPGRLVGPRRTSDGHR
jgi:hypothetical protein